jgi:hypothetical protein
MAQRPRSHGNQYEFRRSSQGFGEQMGMSIWIPKADRGPVQREWQPLLQRLPLNYDDTTLRTVERIDVFWLRRRSIVRAFEVEHTTSVYSGILRMADLLALQPNMDIKLHVVAPETKRKRSGVSSTSTTLQTACSTSTRKRRTGPPIGVGRFVPFGPNEPAQEPAPSRASRHVTFAALLQVWNE